MGVLDWSIVIILNGGTILYGLYLSRGVRSSADWFLAGRQLPWWLCDPVVKSLRASCHGNSQQDPSTDEGDTAHRRYGTKPSLSGQTHDVEAA